MRTLYVGLRLAASVDWSEGQDPTAVSADGLLQAPAKAP
jgi:hypothetical protein